jgi:hypothetical protein
MQQQPLTEQTAMVSRRNGHITGLKGTARTLEHEPLTQADTRDGASHARSGHGHEVRRRGWILVVRVVGAHVPETLPQDDLVVAAIAGAQEHVAALGVDEDAVDHFLCEA